MNAFLRNVGKLSSGRLLSMLIAVVATPIISRLFSPADYGVAAFFVATALILSSVYSFAYGRAIVFPKGDKTAGELLVLSMLISVAACLVSYLVIVAGEFLRPGVFIESKLGRSVWFVPIGALLLAIREILRNTCLRKDRYAVIASSDIAESAFMASTRILWGLVLASSVAGLVLGHFVGLIVAILICLSTNASWGKSAFSATTKNELWQTARAFRDYPLYRLPAKFAFVFSHRLPIVAFAAIFPAEVAGFYAMANRAASAPIQAAGQSVADVLLRSLLDRRHSGQKLAAGVTKALFFLVAAGAPIFLVIFFFGKDLLTLILSERWKMAGEFLKVLSPLLFFLWIGSFAATVFETLRLNKLRLNLNFGNLTVRIVTFGTCAYLQLSALQTLRVFTIVGSAFVLMTIVIALVLTKRHDRESDQSLEDGP